MELKAKQRNDQESEQTRAGDSRRLPTTRTPHHNSVLVLKEMEESERAGRFCRILKYQTKSVRRSKETDLKTGQVFSLSDEPDKRHGLQFRMEGHGSGVRTREAENEKNGVGDGKRSHPAKHKRPRARNACELCGKEYVSNQNLVYHMRIHTGEKPYMCTICQKGFRRKDWLSSHMKVHEDKPQAFPDAKEPKRHACDQCEKTYQTKESLLQHLRVHTGVRPYQCAICEKRFYFEVYLQDHFSSHSDDRPFTCSLCGHGFKRERTLKKHMRIHTGEKNYSCNRCGKKFAYSYSVSVHMKTCSRS